MVVDDLVVCGAEPLFMTDYMVFGVLRPERAAAILSGVAEGCVQAGCALIGGETAEHPGHFGPDDFDLAGAATGVVEQDDLLGPHRVTRGDVVLAMASSGLHSNGFSLVRQVAGPGRARPGRRSSPSSAARSGRNCSRPTRIYARDCLALAAACEVHAFAHVTGGGPGRQPGPGAARRGGRGAGPGQLAPARRLRPARRARRGAGRRRWSACSTWASAWSRWSARADADRALGTLASRGVPAWVLGEIVPGTGTARLSGQHPAA